LSRQHLIAPFVARAQAWAPKLSCTIETATRL
jgi:hypothetical protein